MGWNCSPLVNRPPTTLTYRSPSNFCLLQQEHSCCATVFTYFQQYSFASQTDTSNSRKTFVLSVNQLGSPASLAQLGFFINKGASHIKEYIDLSFLKEGLYILESILRAPTTLKAFPHFSSYFLSNTPKRLPLFLSLPLSFKERGELSMNHALLPPCSELCLPFVKQREWWKWQSRHLPWTTADIEGEKEGVGGEREVHCLMGETHNEATNLQRLSLIVTVQEVLCY